MAGTSSGSSRRYYKPALFMLIGLAVIAGIFSLVQYYRYKNRTATA